jgi:hypothetical protein
MRGFWQNFGNVVGNIGLNVQDPQDTAAAMYADPSATMAQPGGETYAGVQNFEAAPAALVASAKQKVLLILGAGIILITLITSD